MGYASRNIPCFGSRLPTGIREVACFHCAAVKWSRVPSLHGPLICMTFRMTGTVTLDRGLTVYFDRDFAVSFVRDLAAIIAPLPLAK
jgi:hypothetical protein